MSDFSEMVEQQAKLEIAEENFKKQVSLKKEVLKKRSFWARIFPFVFVRRGTLERAIQEGYRMRDVALSCQEKSFNSTHPDTRYYMQESHEEYMARKAREIRNDKLQYYASALLGTTSGRIE